MASNKRKEVKGFKPETIKKIVAALVLYLNMYMAMLKRGEKLAISVSEGNSKIGRTMNVSLAPVITCGNCKECKYFCYDVKACCQYDNVRKARAKNTAIFQFSRDEFFRQVWEKMSHKRTNKYLRFHVPGEIVDNDHLEWFIKTARRFPDFRIWTYTKMYHIVNEYVRTHGGDRSCIPENLVIMFSEWKGLPIVNPYGFPVFRCISEDETVPEGLHKCPGNCNACKEGKTGCIYGMSSYVFLH